MQDYTFTKPSVHLAKLEQEINDNLLITAILNHSHFLYDDQLMLTFESALTVGEETELLVVVNAHVPLKYGAKNFLVEKFKKSRLDKETWYDTDNGDGTYSTKVQETTYKYNGTKLESKETKQFFLDGNVRHSEKWNYYTQTDDKSRVKKKEKD